MVVSRKLRRKFIGLLSYAKKLFFEYSVADGKSIEKLPLFSSWITVWNQQLFLTLPFCGFQEGAECFSSSNYPQYFVQNRGEDFHA